MVLTVYGVAGCGCIGSRRPITTAFGKPSAYVLQCLSLYNLVVRRPLYNLDTYFIQQVPTEIAGWKAGTDSILAPFRLGRWPSPVLEV